MATTRLAIIGELNKAGATDVASSSTTGLTITPVGEYPDYANGKLEFAPRTAGGTDRAQGIRIARPFTESSGYYVVRGGANFTGNFGRPTVFSAESTVLGNVSGVVLIADPFSITNTPSIVLGQDIYWAFVINATTGEGTFYFDGVDIGNVINTNLSSNDLIVGNDVTLSSTRSMDGDIWNVEFAHLTDAPDNPEQFATAGLKFEPAALDPVDSGCNRVALIGELNKSGATDVASSSTLGTGLSFGTVPGAPRYANGKLQWEPYTPGGADAVQGIRVVGFDIQDATKYYVIRGQAEIMNAGADPNHEEYLLDTTGSSRIVASDQVIGSPGYGGQTRLSWAVILGTDSRYSIFINGVSQSIGFGLDAPRDRANIGDFLIGLHTSLGLPDVSFDGTMWDIEFAVCDDAPDGVALATDGRKFDTGTPPTTPAPTAPQSQYDFNFQENQPAGTQIGTITGITNTTSVASDDSDLVVSLSGDTITLTSGRQFDFEANESFAAQITLTGQGGDLVLSVNVSITDDISDNPPTAPQSNYAFTIQENQSIGTQIGAVSGVTNATSATSSNADVAVRLQGGTLFFTNNKVFDFESEQEARSTITITGSGGSIDISVIWTITDDTSDNPPTDPPTAPQSLYHRNFRENQPAGTIIRTISGITNTTSVVSSNSDIVASLSGDTITLTFASGLDLELGQGFTTLITLIGPGGRVQITFNVTIIDDTSDNPTAPQTFYTFNFQENQPIGTEIGTITGITDTTSITTLNLLAVGTIDVVASLSGDTITLTSGREFDFESEQEVSIQITLTGPGGDTRISVDIHITNDPGDDPIAPQFPETAYNFNIIEGPGTNRFVGQITGVTGRPTPTLILVGTTDFTIEPDGTIRNVVPLDFENTQSYSFRVEAENSVPISAVPVRVSVINDPSDDPLRFLTSALPTLQLTIGRPFPVTRPLPGASAGNRAVSYSTSPLPPGIDFDPLTRRLSGTPTTAGTTTVVYRATDSTGFVELSFDIVVVAVQKPVINLAGRSGQIIENNLVDQIISAISVANLRGASITSENPDIRVGFSGATAIAFRAGRVFDYEIPTDRRIESKITVTNAGGSASFTYVLTVLNDPSDDPTPPTFRETRYSFSVFDGNSQNAVVGTIEGISGRPEPVLTIEGTHADRFSVSGNRSATIRTTQTLDIGDVAEYSLTLVATNSEGSARVPVTVSVVVSPTLLTPFKRIALIGKTGENTNDWREASEYKGLETFSTNTAYSKEEGLVFSGDAVIQVSGLDFTNTLIRFDLDIGEALEGTILCWRRDGESKCLVLSTGMLSIDGQGGKSVGGGGKDTVLLDISTDKLYVNGD